MATEDSNGCLHGRDGRFIPKHTYDDECDAVIEISGNSDIGIEIIPSEYHHQVSREDFSLICRTLANMKRKYGDNFPDIEDGCPIVLDDKVAMVCGFFEEFSINYVVAKNHFLYYLFLEEQNDEF